MKPVDLHPLKEMVVIRETPWGLILGLTALGLLLLAGIFFYFRWRRQPEKAPVISPRKEALAALVEARPLMDRQDQGGGVQRPGQRYSARIS